MAAPKETLWKRDPHTAAKHDLLRHYLEAWFPIMLQGPFGGVTYAEGFAGPGEYIGGDPGSPVLAIEQALERPDIVVTGKPIRFALVEARRDRFDHLREIVGRRWPASSRPSHVHIRGEHGRCEESLLPLLTKVGAWGAPIFANLDGWGMVPYSIVGRIGKNKSSEVLVTFTVDFFVRFAGSGDTEAADTMFNGTQWRAVASMHTDDKRRFVVDQYRMALRTAGFPFSTAFEMVDEGGHCIFIVYGSSHRRGLEVMKDAMWKVDRVYGVRFRDPRDPAQTSLDIYFDEPDLAPLRLDVLEEIRKRGRATVQQLRDFALFDTVYRPTHAHRVLRDLTVNGKLGRNPQKGQLTKSCEVFLR